jgi:predicted DNA-binding transcriptional regulator YafY
MRASRLLSILLLLQTRAARDSAGPPDPDGRVRVVIPIESNEHAAGTLLRLGAEAEVLAPVELRRRTAETIAALAATYAV